MENARTDLAEVIHPEDQTFNNHHRFIIIITTSQDHHPPHHHHHHQHPSILYKKKCRFTSAAIFNIDYLVLASDHGHSLVKFFWNRIMKNNDKANNYDDYNDIDNYNVNDNAATASSIIFGWNKSMTNIWMFMIMMICLYRAKRHWLLWKCEGDLALTNTGSITSSWWPQGLHFSSNQKLNTTKLLYCVLKIVFGQAPVLHLKTAGERILSVDKVTFLKEKHFSKKFLKWMISPFHKKYLEWMIYQLTRWRFSNRNLFHKKYLKWSFTKSTWNLCSQVGNILLWDSLGACSSLLELQRKDDLLSIQQQVNLDNLSYHTSFHIKKSNDSPHFRLVAPKCWLDPHPIPIFPLCLVLTSTFAGWPSQRWEAFYTSLLPSENISVLMKVGGITLLDFWDTSS